MQGRTKAGRAAPSRSKTWCPSEPSIRPEPLQARSHPLRIPMLADELQKGLRFVIDEFVSGEGAELDMIVEEVDFDPRADQRNGYHDRIVPIRGEVKMN